MINYNFSVSGVPTQSHNPQPGGPVDYFLSDPYPLICLAWVTLPGAYTPASLALRVVTGYADLLTTIRC